MKRFFVFRLDGAQANAGYFERRSRGVPSGRAVSYQGRTLSIGAKWKPDLVEVELSHDGRTATLTLVELESRPVTLMVSCRKYLPESTADIIKQFLKYLRAVVNQCRKTADPRLPHLAALKSALEGGVKTVVRTAGALRTGNHYYEMYALMNQPQLAKAGPTFQSEPDDEFVLTGRRALTSREIGGLRRVVRIFQAVIEDEVHFACPLFTWQSMAAGRKPLDVALMRQPENFPVLYGLLERYFKKGRNLDCDALADELALLWTQKSGRKWTRTRAARVVEAFLETAINFPREESMRVIFQAARQVLEENGWRKDGTGKKAA